ncbi:MAG: glutamate-cysteine ligase family protein [Myxococcales bacterium]|nr:glutamate-cysteine ligase family protein [Myxococcales bacterium]MDH3483240.1 glutamate-cysteine ligase family protein [Myxococcales bacterium]
MSAPEPLGLFEGFGIEIEYMIVDAESLSVRPIADELLKEVAGTYEMEVDRGALRWSNELALHVLELKTNGPTSSLVGLHESFQGDIRAVDALLSPMGARLLPGAMHPWMGTDELRLWPHEDDVIYRSLHRIFDCRGHGWSNLQSVHLNLPFANDDQFGRLHAAARLVLPILPALAASSPYVDGKASGLLDTRLEVYRHNARRIPSVTGRVIPEAVFRRRDYELLLGSIYQDLAPLDPEGVLQHEWVNARGCIARFDRMALEIRLVDVQECPRMDLAIAQAASAAIQALVEETWVGLEEQQAWDERDLEAILLLTIGDADHAMIDDPRFLRTFGLSEKRPVRADEVWHHLVDTQVDKRTEHASAGPALRLISNEGCLARRLVRAAGPSPSRERLREVYGRLADCLAFGRSFSGEP